jgi:hypothetical protein
MKNYIMFITIIFIASICYLSSDTFNLKCTIAVKDGKKYCVRDSSLLKESVELLAEVNDRMQKMVDYLNTKYPSDLRVERLSNNFNPNKIVETLPTSEYTAYSENKGEKLAFCLRQYKNSAALIDINTLTFVALHELSHLMSASVGHNEEFWANFKFMLDNAVIANIYKPIDYSKSPVEYCGMSINSNPLYTKRV